MDARFRSWWQYIGKHWITTLIIVFVCVILLIVLGYLFKWDWTGFNNGTSQITITSPSNGNYRATLSQPSKTLWDWLQLLAVLAIPVVVGLGAAWFTVQQGKVKDRDNKDNQREKALQDYIDKISELLLKEHLDERTADGILKPEYEQARKIARVLTITVLNQLDVRRIGYVFAFLREAELMSTVSNSDVVSLGNADFSEVNWNQANLSKVNLGRANLSNASLSNSSLREANLSRANLSYTNLLNTNLRGADLTSAKLSNVNLSGADLRETNFIRADLTSARLVGAKLYGAKLSKADLSESDLSEAEVENANVSGADLSGATLWTTNLKCANLSNAKFIGARLDNVNLEGANLKDAIGITIDELEKQAKSLKGATMPDGSIHP
jgi:uncharacterized protein YjbI with pentapeptide repeats